MEVSRREKNSEFCSITVAYAMTGSVLVGGALALIEPAINTVAFYLHEQVWARMSRPSADRGVAEIGVDMPEPMLA